MFRKSMKQVAILGLSALLLGGPAVAAGGHDGLPKRATRNPGHGVSLWSRALGWVQVLWAGQEGCLDPNGWCLNSAGVPPPAQLDQGGCIDPNGRCASSTLAPQPATDVDQGACIDPNGRCLASLGVH